VDNPSGNAGNMEADKVIVKFRDAAQTLGSESAIAEAEAMTMSLEKLDDVRELTRRLSGKAFSKVGIRF
jgi:hypothetical protein